MGAVAIGAGARRQTRRRAAVDFRLLLGPAAWAALPAEVQARFSASAHNAPCCYQGTMQVRASWLGRLFAQACRLLGTPLAPWTGADVPVRVDVYTDEHGLVWDRTYAFPGRAPMRVSSHKALGRNEGLEEVIRGGLGMRLSLSVEGGALHFRSGGYFLRVAGLTIPIPQLLTPGTAHVIHQPAGPGRFRFTLRFVHTLAGETIFQTGLFDDPARTGSRLGQG